MLGEEDLRPLATSKRLGSSHLSEHQMCLALARPYQNLDACVAACRKLLQFQLGGLISALNTAAKRGGSALMPPSSVSAVMALG